MKKILLTLSVSCFTMAYTQTLNFVDSKFKALMLTSNSTNEIAKDQSGASIAIDTNGDGEIQLSEAQQVKILTIKQDKNFKYIDPSGAIWDPDNINTTYYLDHLPDGITDVLLFPNVEELYLADTKDATISFVNNSKIKKVKDFDAHDFTGGFNINLTFDNCTALQDLNNVVNSNNESLGNKVRLTIKNCSQINSDVLLETSLLKELYLENSSISTFTCYGNFLKKITINNDSSITKVFTYDTSNPISMYMNHFVDFTANNCPNLLEIKSDSDHYSSLGQYFNPVSLSACPSLKKILGVSSPTLDFSNFGLINLEELDCSFYNRNGYVGTSGAGNEQYYVGNLTSLNLSGLPKLKILRAFNQPITFANFTAAPSLENIDITNSSGFMNTVDVSNLTNLHTLKINTIFTNSNSGPDSRVLKSITAENCTALVNLDFQTHHSLESLNLYNCSGLQSLILPSFYQSYFPNLSYLNIKKCYSLKTLEVSRTPLTSIDASDCSLLENFYLSYVDNLQFVNIKNNSIETNTSFNNYNSNLSMCVDNAQLASLQTTYPDITFTSNCGSTLGTDSHDFDKNEIKLYPNPAKDFVELKSKENIKNIQLFDEQGRLIINRNYNQNLIKIDLSSQTSGIYLLKIKTDTSESAKKIIKK